MMDVAVMGLPLLSVSFFFIAGTVVVVRGGDGGGSGHW